MAGFANVAQWADSAITGKSWLSSFRKVTSVTAIASQWFDFSTTSGNPVPNYYASSPLTAALLDPEKGIFHGSNVSPLKKYIHRLMLMNSGGATTANLPVYFLDYLLYYPFFDMDAAGEDQICINTQPLTRYTDGEGVRMMMVAQASTLGGGQFTVTYINQDGVQKTTPNHFCAAAQNTGALVQATTSASGTQPFISLADGDTGVRSVVSVNFSISNGGLSAIVLVKPLQNIWVIENTATPIERENVRENSALPEIKDNAFLGYIAHIVGGSGAGMTMAGILETIWR